MRLTTLSLRSADRQRAVEQLEFVPGRPALDIEVGAEAQGMDGLPDHVLDGAEACQIDDRDDLAGDVRKAVAGAGQHLWRSLDLAGIVGWRRTVRSRRGLRRFRGRPGPRSRRSGGSSGRCSRRRNGCAAQPAIRPAAASGNGVLAAIWARPDRSRTGRFRWRSGGRRAASGRAPARRGELLRAQAFDGIAVDAGDLGRWGGGHAVP